MKRLILLAIPLIGACDGDKVPDEPIPPAPPKVVSTTTDVAAPAPDESSRVQRAPEHIDEVEIAPVTAGDSEQVPSERIVPPPARKPAAVAVSKKAVEKVELPEPELDLSLPDDWRETLAPADEPATMSLLPPLFESSTDSRSLQMSGALLPGASEDETIIDGAQINFELKR